MDCCWRHNSIPRKRKGKPTKKSELPEAYKVRSFLDWHILLINQYTQTLFGSSIKYGHCYNLTTNFIYFYKTLYKKFNNTKSFWELLPSYATSKAQCSIAYKKCLNCWIFKNSFKTSLKSILKEHVRWKASFGDPRTTFRLLMLFYVVDKMTIFLSQKGKKHEYCVSVDAFKPFFRSTRTRSDADS